MSKELNKTLRGFADGALAASVELQCSTGLKREVGRVYVYWPFVTFETVRGEWNVTHAPTGYWTSGCRSKTLAVALIRAFRDAADWDFTSSRGRKAVAATRASKHLLPKYQRLA